MSQDNPFKIQEGQIRDSKVSGFIKHRKTGDYLDFGFLDKAEHLGKFFNDKKVKVLFLIVILFLFILFARALYLQGFKGNYFRNIAEGNRIRLDIIKANRGLIYDRFDNLLVKNISYFFLYINFDFLPEDELDKQNLLNKLSATLDLDRAEIIDIIYNSKTSSDEILVYENLDYDLAMKLIIMSEKYPSIKVSYEPRRSYLSNLGMAHAIGYLGLVAEEDLKKQKYNYNDRIGKNGLEFVYEDILRGQDGIRQIEVDALFRKKNIIATSEPIDGQDLVLTIDAKAQAKLFEIMLKNAKLYDKPKMSAIVLDPKDGGILSIVSLPSFDSNIFTKALNNDEYNEIITNENLPLLNRSIAGTYPLGSIFKTVVASAALEENLIDDSFRVNSTGGVSIGSSFFPDWRSQGHGWTNVYWALADSVNTFFYSIGGGNNEWLGLGLGVNKIIDYADKFGLGKITGVDLNSEAPGFLPSKDWKEKTFDERWYLGDTYNLSIGQGYLLATPIQAANLIAYFANDGVAYAPHFIKEINDEGQKTTYLAEPVLTNLISSDNLKVVRKGLRDAIIKGTAQSLQSVPVEVAGKTGTAQFNKNKTPHSWMTAFAPYEDPKIAMVVLVEEGGDRGLAVTITREFMEWYFSQ